MAAFTSSCVKRIGKPGLGRSDTRRSLGNYRCMLVEKIGKSTVIQINKERKERKRTCIAPIVSISTTKRSDVDHTELPASTPHVPFLCISIR